MIRRWLLGFLILATSYPLTLTALNLGLGRLLVEQWAARTIGAKIPGQFQVARVTVDPTLRVQLDGVQATVGAGRDLLELSCQTAAVSRWWPTLRRSRWLEGTLAGGQVRSRALRVEELSLAVWDPIAPDRTPAGAVRAARLAIGPLELQDLTGELWRSPSQVALKGLRARCASGILQGALVVETTGAQPTFTLEARVTGVALSDLTPINPTVFAGAQGAGDVTLTAHGTAEGTISFIAAFEVAQPGGAVQAPFLNALMPYVPAAAQTTVLRQAVAQDRPIRFQTARMTVESAAPDTLKALFLMALPEYNVTLDVDFTIHLDDAAALPRVIALWDQLVGDAS